MLNFKQIELLEILISIKKFQDEKKKVDGKDSNTLKNFINEFKSIQRDPKKLEYIGYELNDFVDVKSTALSVKSSHNRKKSMEMNRSQSSKFISQKPKYEISNTELMEYLRSKHGRNENDK